MTLNSVWFIIISVLFTGFFILEGVDYGVGILLPFLGRSDRDRRVLINSIGPFWDANEVWLITAGGAMFAAFPHWYATMFSGFYLALLLMLGALVVRAVAFEFRSKDRHPGWRSLWDWAIFFGSAVPALLWGVALANIVRGVPIDAGMHYVGGFLDLLNPFALLAGLASLLAFTLHGAIFLTLWVAANKGRIMEAPLNRRLLRALEKMPGVKLAEPPAPDAKRDARGEIEKTVTDLKWEDISCALGSLGGGGRLEEILSQESFEQLSGAQVILLAKLCCGRIYKYRGRGEPLDEKHRAAWRLAKEHQGRRL